MGFKCGIVGLPNVGKSTIFNAITNTANAQAANYPFCTIEPNTGRVAVADERLTKLKNIANSQRIIPNYIDIVDIAGLVRGASKGEGLGNQFLGNIREVDAILHVVRAFEDEDITHVENNIDPIRDIEVIETELLLADLSSIEKRSISVAKKAKMGDKDAIAENEVLEKVLNGLNNGIMVRFIDFSDDEKAILKQFHLITAKPVLYVANVNEDNSDKHLLEKIIIYAEKQKAKVVPICAKLESEMMDFSEEDKKSFLVESGFGDTGLGQIIINGYSLLGLITFFTVGEQEARAWSVPQNSTAPVAAGVIHTDFEKHFIKAEVVGYSDFIACEGIAGSKEVGKLRLEGKDYVVKDGDIVHFKTGA